MSGGFFLSRRDGGILVNWQLLPLWRISPAGFLAIIALGALLAVVRAF